MRSKKALINIISVIILQIITIICGFIVPKLIISNYGSKVNGLITSISQFLAFVTLLEAGFGPVIKSVLYKPIANKDMFMISKILKASEKIFKIISYVFIIYILILCVTLPYGLAKDFDIIFTLSLIIIISISMFAEYYFGMTYRLFLQADQKTYIISFIQIGTLIINTIIIVFLINFNCNIQIIKLVSSLIFVLRPILQNIYVKKKYNINLKNVDGNYKIKQKWNGLAQHIAYVINNNADVVILTLYGDIALVSVYSIYMLVINGVKNIVKSFLNGVDSAFGDMIAKNEQEVLNKNFKIYEFIYFTISSIIFSATFFLIIPFIKIYTHNVTDVNYIRPVFAFLIVLANFIWIIRQPYNDLIKVAGHFKETQIGAWVESIINIVLSFILVWKFGIVGVAIGTLVAITIRTIEFMFYVSKNILHRSNFYILKNIGIICVEFLIITVFSSMIADCQIISYYDWISKAIKIGLISVGVIVFISFIVYNKELKEMIKIIKNIVKG